MAPSALFGPTATSSNPSIIKSSSATFSNGVDVRLACRNSSCTTTTSGLAPNFLQANLVVLPSRYAGDFRTLCARNPVPCPLIAESKSTGSWNEIKSWIEGLEGEGVVSNVDLRKDVPRYMVFEDSKLVKSHCNGIMEEWTDDHVAFLVGCSFSFESALANAGLPARHMVMNRVCPVYRTNIPLCPAGVFSGSTYMISMRPYKSSEIEAVRAITRPYVATHGEPIAWGWDAMKQLGINISTPTWGDAPLTLTGKPLVEGDEENVPVVWGCGVTPQEAVANANLEGIAMTHAPGHMLLLDCRDWDVVREIE